MVKIGQLPVNYHLWWLVALKAEKYFCNDLLEESFKGIKFMVSADNLLNFPDWKFLLMYILMPLINSRVLVNLYIFNK